jgi:para-aminobenzoate synthetase/4-amino-4-deoxychorismate lyase
MASARFFDIPVSEPGLRQSLDEHRANHPRDAWLVRLLVSPDGVGRVESTPLEERPNTTLPVALAKTPVARADRFLQHKTTHRGIYDEHRARAADAYDVLLWNEEGELTEFTTGNVVLEIDGERWTPPRESGLLPGTFREELLARGEIRERVVTRTDFESASRRWLVNSVRGWIPVEVRAGPADTRRPR